MIILYKLCIVVAGIYACARICKFLFKQFKKSSLYVSYRVRKDSKFLNNYLYNQDDRGISITDDPYPNKKYRKLVYERLIKKGTMTKYVITNYNNSKKVSASLYIKSGLINGM